jgi:hypothetical protein
VHREGRASVTRPFIQYTDAQRWARQTEIDLDGHDVRFDSECLQHLTLRNLIEHYLVEFVLQKRGADVGRYVLKAMQHRWLADLSLS